MAAPKVYGFDTGFVCHYRGWSGLRPEDLGILWEHLVLNEVQSLTGRRDVRYWRSKAGREVDFILARPGAALTAIECKWKADAFDAAGLLAFRSRYPKGANLVVASDVDRAYDRRYAALRARFVGLGDLGAHLGPVEPTRAAAHGSVGPTGPTWGARFPRRGGVSST